MAPISAVMNPYRVVGDFFGFFRRSGREGLTIIPERRLG